MEEQCCPRCKTTKYRNPSLKLMVNICGHALCENCVELLFVRGSGSCPQCNVALRRNHFRVQLFEDAFVEKDTDIRKRILRDFNKREDDFASLREYNDYLEEVESIIFNLSNGIDVEETKEKIEAYKRDNKDAIRKNRAKLSNEEVFLEDLIEQEKQEKEQSRTQHLQAEMKEKKEKLKNKEALIDDLMFSDLPADHILAQHKHEQTVQETAKNASRATQFSSGIQIGKRGTFLPMPKEEEAECYSYSDFSLDILGPRAPDDVDLNQYLQHMRGATDSELGGGYEASIGCRRAVQEAFCGLFFSLHQDLMTSAERASPFMDVS